MGYSVSVKISKIFLHSCVFLNIANCVVMKIFLWLVVALAVLLEVCGRPMQSDEEVMLPREAWICHLCTRYSSQAWICTLCTREKRSMPQHDPFTTGPHDALDNLEDWSRITSRQKWKKRRQLRPPPPNCLNQRRRPQPRIATSYHMIFTTDAFDVLNSQRTLGVFDVNVESWLRLR